MAQALLGYAIYVDQFIIVFVFVLCCLYTNNIISKVTLALKQERDSLRNPRSSRIRTPGAMTKV